MTTQAPRGIPAEYAGASIVGGHDQNLPVARTREPDDHKYARQTRNATVFIAWVIAVGVALSAIVGIWIGVTLSHAVNGSGGGSGSGYSCVYDGTC